MKKFIVLMICVAISCGALIGQTQSAKPQEKRQEKAATSKTSSHKTPPADSDYREELRKENSRLEAQYNVLSRRMDEAMGVLQDIQQRDDNLYRVIFQADPIPSAIRQAGYGGTNRYEHLMDMADAELVVGTTQKLDMLTKQLYIQSRSFDEVVEMCRQHDEMLRCIPAIQPISNKDLKQTASGYGTRVDPIYGTTRFHSGMDFSAAPGTDVYATGDGTVVKMGWQTGYGNTIIIDHGFGYQTWYAHLQEFRTRPGKKVVRGEVIVHGTERRGLRPLDTAGSQSRQDDGLTTRHLMRYV